MSDNDSALSQKIHFVVVAGRIKLGQSEVRDRRFVGTPNTECNVARTMLP